MITLIKGTQIRLVFLDSDVSVTINADSDCMFEDKDIRLYDGGELYEYRYSKPYPLFNGKSVLSIKWRVVTPNSFTYTQNLINTYKNISKQLNVPIMVSSQKNHYKMVDDIWDESLINYKHKAGFLNKIIMKPGDKYFSTIMNHI